MNMFGSRKRFGFLLESLPNATKRGKFEGESLGIDSRFCTNPREHIQNLVSPNYSSKFQESNELAKRLEEMILV